MGDLRNELLGTSFALVTALVWTIGDQSVQALNGSIPDFELNCISLAGKIPFSRLIFHSV